MADEGRTIREAAIRLGISEGAVRKRITRRQLKSWMGDDGRRRVYVPEDTPKSEVEGSEELLDQLRSEVAYLREENRRKDHMLAGLIQRVPALEPASDERSDVATQHEERDEETYDTGGTKNATPRRSWWRRLFGG